MSLKFAVNVSTEYWLIWSAEYFERRMIKNPTLSMFDNYHQMVEFIHRWLWRLFPQSKQITFYTSTFNKQHFLISLCSSMRNYHIRSINNCTLIILYLVKVEINTEKDFKNKRKFDWHFSWWYLQSLSRYILCFHFYIEIISFALKPNQMPILEIFCHKKLVSIL